MLPLTGTGTELLLATLLLLVVVVGTPLVEVVVSVITIVGDTVVDNANYDDCIVPLPLMLNTPAKLSDLLLDTVEIVLFAYVVLVTIGIRLDADIWDRAARGSFVSWAYVIGWELLALLLFLLALLASLAKAFNVLRTD